jgi:hypothetical protein
MIRRPALLALAALLACTSARRLGDQAAATGDWKSAERAYAQALRDDPDDPEARTRWQTARAKALATSVARARACAGAEDWECAFAEADYAVQLDGADGELARFRRDAAREAARTRLRRAEDAGRRRDHAEALELLAGARAASDEPGIRAEAQRLQPAIVRGAVEAAEALRRERQYPQAIALLEAAAGADGSVRPRLEAARAEHARLLDEEYARLEREGDAHLARREWADAQERYDAATRVRGGGRAATLARYAGHLRAGEAATQARDWPRATQAYQAAVALGLDRGDVAARELEAVRVRRYAVQLRRVLVRPARPDGQPWIGARTRVFDAVMIGARAADRGFESDDPSALRTAIEVATAVPDENQPELWAVIDLGGRRFRTPPRRSLHATPDASVVVAANHHDERLVTIRVVQRAGAGDRDVGVVQVRLADLLSRGRVALRAASLARVELAVAPADAQEWTATGCAADLQGRPLVVGAPAR